MKRNEYVGSLKGCIVKYNEAKKNGVVLSRLENFDYMFKRELASEMGIRQRDGGLSRLVRTVQDVDYRVACFYASVMSDLCDIQENGYSFELVSNLFKYYAKYAHSKSICRKKFYVIGEDSNNLYEITISDGIKDIFTFTISNKSECISALIAFTSMLGSKDEKESDEREWFERYLDKEFRKYPMGQEATPYVEGKKVVRNLKSYMAKPKKAKADENAVGSEQKVVAFRAM